MNKLYFSLFIMLFTCTFVHGQGKDEFKPEVKIGATVFTGWEFNVDNANFISKLDTSAANPSAAFGYNPAAHQFETSMNSFYLERAYINVKASLAPNVKARVTPDIISLKDQSGATQYRLGVKYAWFDWTAYQGNTGLAVDFTLGVIPNRWIEKNEGYMGYRVFAKSFTDYGFTTSASVNGNTVSRSTGSFFSSADLGVEGMLTLPKGFSELYVRVLNGNGYANLNFDNRFKDFESVVYIHPLAEQISKKMNAVKKAGKSRLAGINDLTIGGLVYLGKLGLGENPSGAQFIRNRFGGLANLKVNFSKFGFFRIGGEFDVQSNQDPSAVKPDSAVTITSSGFSGWLELNPPVKELDEKLSFFARYDQFDPNTANDNASATSFNNNTDKQSLLILGLVYKPAKVLTLGITYQAVTYQSEYIVKYDGSTSKSDSRLLIQSILDF
jgi:hypothetical protein